ncbi:PfkB family carbohydrate kinase [Marinifilum sp. RC60d5]|uniref:PfkB family carbohydrate kinase n=1 Tax=Marinifilum sp. RC60d5 TaxID=3458414 RepID=UPI0040350811
MRRVYTIGDCVLDLFFENNKPVDARPGGSFLNSSVSLGRLGASVSLISELGIDRIGNQILDFLKVNNVNTDHIAQFSDTNSNLAIAFLDEQKNAEYSFYKTRKGLDTCIKFPKNIKSGDVILFGSFLAIKKEFRPALIRFLKESRSKGALIIYDPNFRAQHLPLLHEVVPFIKENIEVANLVKGSDEDFKLICNANSAKDANKWIRGFSSATLVYTANKNAVVVCTDETYSFEVPKITPVSTVGAGDTVNASIAYFLLRENINAEQINKLGKEQVRELVKIAIKFSQEVCLGYDNFISTDMGEEFRL